MSGGYYSAAQRAPINTKLWKYGETVLEEIARKNNLSAEVIRGKTRPRNVVECRQDIAHHFRERGWSLPQIGCLMHRDHSTILHALRKRAERHG